MMALGVTYSHALGVWAIWSGTVAGSVTRTYDSNFWVTSTSVNGANTATFAYEDDGLLTQAGDLAISRDAASGFITGTSLGAITDTWTYNSYGEPASYTASGASGDLYAVAYARDALGRITQKAETIAGDQMTWDYGYDTAGRLMSSTLTTSGATFPTTYAYDANGNRLSKTGQFGTENGTYDDQDRMTSYGACAYAYTANGELTTRTCGTQVTSYSYDDFGNLTRVTMPDGIEIDYVLDARNRRVGKKVNGTLVQGFLYRDQLNPVAELDGSGSIVARFVYGTKPNVPDYMVKGGMTYRYVTDQLGSVRLVVDASTGTVAQRIDYEEYGAVIQDSSPGFQPFGFAGGITDSHTGLVRFGARDYDPQTGRWTSKDDWLFAGGSWNLFSYVDDRPVAYPDITGYSVYVCNRRSFSSLGFQFNHAYLWRPTSPGWRQGESCGMQSSCGADPSSTNNPENGPLHDACAIVLRSTGFEDKIMGCCHAEANSGMWIPGFHDCHSAAARCLGRFGFPFYAPGGRIGSTRGPWD